MYELKSDLVCLNNEKTSKILMCSKKILFKLISRLNIEKRNLFCHNMIIK